MLIKTINRHIQINKLIYTFWKKTQLSYDIYLLLTFFCNEVIRHHFSFINYVFNQFSLKTNYFSFPIFKIE